MRWQRIRRRMRTRLRDLRTDGVLRSWKVSLPEPLWARQTLACLAILALVLVGKSLEGFRPVAVTMNAVRYTLSADYDFKSAWAKLPSLQTLGGQRLNDALTPWVDRVRSFLRLGNAPRPEEHQMTMPVNGTVTSHFGKRSADGKTENHTGLDVTAPTGMDIVAALGGQVSRVGVMGDYGLVVVIDHGQGLETIYAHCSETLVQEKQQVLQGQVIAKVGQTGDADGPHVHFEIRVNNRAVDPTPWLVMDTGG
ncbi:MAG: M23 family metallopeptidase [Bacillota bacterium]